MRTDIVHMRRREGQIERVNEKVISKYLALGWEIVDDPTPASSTAEAVSVSEEAPPSKVKSKRSSTRSRAVSRRSR